MKINHTTSNKQKEQDFFLSPYSPNSDTGAYHEEGQLSCDVYQNKNNIYIKSAVAGVDPKNLDISVSNDVLTIRGFREQDEEISNEDSYAREIYWGAFSRSVVLPQQIDQKKVEATLKNGILTITLPKKYKTSSIKIRHIEED